MNKANSEISDILRNRYFEGLGAGIDAVRTILARHGFSTEVFDGFYCGRDGRLNGSIGGGRFICFTWHRMEVTGTYEVVAYVS